MARKYLPDVVVMDLLMPGMDGIQATGIIRRELPDTEVIALTSVLEDASVIGAVRAGAIGYLLKDAGADELCRAIRAAAAGQVQLSPKAAERLMREVRAPDNPEVLTAGDRGAAADGSRQGKQGNRPRRWTSARKRLRPMSATFWPNSACPAAPRQPCMRSASGSSTSSEALIGIRAVPHLQGAH